MMFTAVALHPSNLELQVHAGVAAGQIACLTHRSVVKASKGLATDATGRFFRRRRKDTMRALGSPKKPRTMGSGRKPGNRYASGRRRGFRIQKSYQVSRPEEIRETTQIRPRSRHSARKTTHTL